MPFVCVSVYTSVCCVQVEIPAKITPAMMIEQDDSGSDHLSGSPGSPADRPVFVTGSPSGSSPDTRRLETPSPSLVDSSDMHHFSSSPQQPIETVVARSSSKPKVINSIVCLG